MNIIKIAVSSIVCLICCELGFAQHVLDPHADFHAGIHSGSWTLKRSQLAEEESKDPHRSCFDPYCARCAKHLADYGHEYQYITGSSLRKPWYGGTRGNVAIIPQRGYVSQRKYEIHDPRHVPLELPAAIISWEYLQTLNHAIWEQVNARNAVAAEEAAHDRIVLLTQLLADASEQLRLTKEAWEQLEHTPQPCTKVVVGGVVGSRCTKTFKQFSSEMKAGRYEVARQGMCVHCLAHARYQFDLAYVADVERELALAHRCWVQKNAIATEAVRIALLSKADADKATRFKRIQHKPPKYREVLAAMGVTGWVPENGEQGDEIEP